MDTSIGETALRESIDVFLSYMANERRVAPNTISAYQNDLRQFAEYLGEPSSLHPSDETDIPILAALGASELAEFVLLLRDKGYAQATVARKIAAVKSFFHFAIESGLIRVNPAASLDSPRVHRSIPHQASDEDVQTLIRLGCAGSQPDSLRNCAMLTLLYHSGMRVSEVVALDTLDVDLDLQEIHCSGRAGRSRTIPLSTEAHAALVAYLEEGRPAFTRASELVDHALFLNHRGTRLTRQGFWLILKDRARDAGIAAPMTPHALRHAFAFQHLGNGTGLRELKELLGHMNISTTQIYAMTPNVAPVSA